jgi:hypothetical protein
VENLPVDPAQDQEIASEAPIETVPESVLRRLSVLREEHSLSVSVGGSEYVHILNSIKDLPPELQQQIVSAEIDKRKQQAVHDQSIEQQVTEIFTAKTTTESRKSTRVQYTLVGSIIVVFLGIAIIALYKYVQPSGSIWDAAIALGALGLIVALMIASIKGRILLKAKNSNMEAEAQIVPAPEKENLPVKKESASNPTDK